MSKPGDIYLGLPGQEILLPALGRKLTIKPIEIIREERTASGRLVIEIIARKNTFIIEYELLKGPDLEMILDLYNLRKDLNLIIYNRNGTPMSYTVWLRPFNQPREEAEFDWLWSGITLELEEV